MMAPMAGTHTELSSAALAWRARGRTVTVAGHEVFVVEEGTGPCLLMLHGFPTSCLDWRRVIDLLAGRFRCVAFDFPGFGLSDKPVAYSYSLFQQADVVEGLAAALGVREAHVLSHDMGTSVHTELLAREREDTLGFAVRSSTFLNGSMIKEMARITEFQRLLEDPARIAEAVRVCEVMTPLYAEGLRRLMARPEAFSDEDAAVATELLVHRDGNRRLPAIYGYVRERYLHADRWLGALAAACGPVQLVWAVDDPVANVGMGRAIAERAPRARYLEVPGVGHFLPIEAPEVVASAVADFAFGPHEGRPAG